jgi:hypothetical protein
MMEIVYWLMGLSFTLVSVVFAGRLLMQTYLDYVEAKEGIRIVKEQFAQMNEEEEEGFHD